jgi:DNA-binding NarL/FixJ family response regulator
MTRIFIADDHDVVRSGLRTIIQARPGFEVIGEAADGKQALELIISTLPDVAVLDYSMPIITGVELTRRIRKRAPATEILLFTMHDSERLMREALQAGARGYLLKSDASSHLISAVEALSRHEAYISGKVSVALLDALINDSPSTPSTLTVREQEVVKLIAEGHSNKDMGALLNLGLKTIETHRASAMRKTGARSTAGLVKYAIRNHLAEP